MNLVRLKLNQFFSDENVRDYLVVDLKDGVGTLTLKKKLSQDMLKETELNIMIKLLVKDTNETLDDAFITLLLPNGQEGVDFEQPIFTGEFKITDDGKESMDKISITLNSDNVDVVECGLDKSK